VGWVEQRDIFLQKIYSVCSATSADVVSSMETKDDKTRQTTLSYGLQDLADYPGDHKRVERLFSKQAEMLAMHENRLALLEHLMTVNFGGKTKTVEDELRAELSVWKERAIRAEAETANAVARAELLEQRALAAEARLELALDPAGIPLPKTRGSFAKCSGDAAAPTDEELTTGTPDRTNAATFSELQRDKSGDLANLYEKEELQKREEQWKLMSSLKHSPEVLHLEVFSNMLLLHVTNYVCS